jgi:integrase/recombinase XerC/integrase/recombinase XerD
MITDEVQTTEQVSQLPTNLAKNDWVSLIAFFVSNQDVAESSRKLYSRVTSLFFEWVENTGRSISALTRLDIIAYKEELLRQGLSALTVGSYLMAVRRFYEWTETLKLYPNIAKGVKSPRKKQAFKKQHLSETKCTELLAYYAERSIRDYAIASLLLRCGLRTIEVIRANVGDITFMGERRVLRIWGKGHAEKDDYVVLSDKAYEPIKAYLRTRVKLNQDAPLFVSESRQNRGDRLTTRTISKICKQGLVAIGMDGKEFTAHSLRHTTAVTILKHGGNIENVQSVLRHTSPVTSQIYTESIKNELRLRDAPELLIDNAF